MQIDLATDEIKKDKFLQKEILIGALNGLNSCVLIIEKNFNIIFANEFSKGIFDQEKIRYGNNLLEQTTKNHKEKLNDFIISEDEKYPEKINFSGNYGKQFSACVRKKITCENLFILYLEEISYSKKSSNLNSENEIIPAGKNSVDNIKSHGILDTKCYEFANQFPGIFFEVDTEGNLTFANDKALKTFGYSQNEIQSLNPYKIFSVYDKLVLNQILRSLAEGTVTGNLELSAVKKDGTVFPVILHAIPFFKNGITAGFRGFLIDITDKKKIEEEAIEKEKRFRYVLENTHLLNLILNVDGTISFCNDYFLKITGFTRDEIIGKDWFDVLIPDNQKNDMYRVYFKSITGNNLPDYQENLICKKDGGAVLVAWHNATLKDKFGNTIATTSIGIDITEKRENEKKLEIYRHHLEKMVAERTGQIIKINKKLENKITRLKLIEEKLKDQYQYLHTLINTVPIPIYLKDENDKYLIVNEAFQKATGIAYDEIIGKDNFKVTSKENAEKLSKYNKELLKKPGHKTFEVSYDSPEGEIVTVLISKASLVKGSGEIAGIVGAVTDITQQKKLEHKIKKALEHEKELNELKTRFISATSHEFRTPLTSILSAADILGMYKDQIDEAKYFELIKIIQTSVENLNSLITDLHSIKDTEIKADRFFPHEFSLEDLYEEILNEFKIITENEKKFETVLTSKTKIIYADRKLLKQTITNLINNAIKYSHQNSLISFKISDEKNSLKISVEDNGIGIEEKDIKKIFEPFYRGKNSEFAQGSGLGLSIVKKAVDLHKGKIICKSKPGKGTKFEILIPQKDI